MNYEKSCVLARLRNSRLSFCIVALMINAQVLAEPAWWVQRGVRDPRKAPNDFAAANQGQLKVFAQAARDEMNARLAGGAGQAVENMVTQWQADNSGAIDFAAVNLGQIKHVARPIYERLVQSGRLTGLPAWLASSGSSDFSTANIGQLKNVFSFDLEAGGQGEQGVPPGSGTVTFPPNDPPAGPTEPASPGYTPPDWLPPAGWQEQPQPQPPVAPSGAAAPPPPSSINVDTLIHDMGTYASMADSKPENYTPPPPTLEVEARVNSRLAVGWTSNGLSNQFTGTYFLKADRWDGPAYPTPSDETRTEQRESGPTPPDVYFYLVKRPRSWQYNAGREKLHDFEAPSSVLEQWDSNMDGVITEEDDYHVVSGPPVLYQGHQETLWSAEWSSGAGTMLKGGSLRKTYSAPEQPWTYPKGEAVFSSTPTAGGGVGGAVVGELGSWLNLSSWNLPPDSDGDVREEMAASASDARIKVVCSTAEAPETIDDIMSSLVPSTQSLFFDYRVRDHAMPEDVTKYVSSFTLAIIEGQYESDEYFISVPVVDGEQHSYTLLYRDKKADLSGGEEPQPGPPPLQQEYAGSPPESSRQVHEITGRTSDAAALDGLPADRAAGTSSSSLFGLPHMSASVDVFNGRLNLHSIDLTSGLGTSGLPLQVTRSLTPSVWADKGSIEPWDDPLLPFGPGWHSNLSAGIQLTAENGFLSRLVVTDHRGESLVFAPRGTSFHVLPWSVSSAEDFKTVLERTSTGFKLTRLDGEKTLFETAGVARDRSVSSSQSTRTTYARLKSVEDAAGNKLEYTYGASDVLIPETIADPARGGRKMTIIYDKSIGRVMSVKDAAGKPQTYFYKVEKVTGKDLNLLDRAVQRNGCSTFYAYDFAAESLEMGASARVNYRHVDLHAIADGLGNAKFFEWKPNRTFERTRQYSGITDSDPEYEGLRSLNFIEPGHPRVLAAIRHGAATSSPKTKFERNRRVLTVDAPQNEGPHVINATVTVTDSLSGQWQWKYEEPDLRKITEEQWRGGSASQENHTLLRYKVTRITDPLQNAETFTYLPEAGMVLTRHRDIDSSEERHEYTRAVGLGAMPQVFEYYSKPTATIDEALQQTSWTYDNALRTASMVDHLQRTTIFVRDPKGQVIEIKYLAADGALLTKAQWVYGSAAYPGFITRKTQQKMVGDPSWVVDRVETYSPDTRGRVLTSVVDPTLKLTTTFSYDDNGNVRTLKNPLNGATSYGRDDAGRITQITSPATAAGTSMRRWSYDKAGRLSVLHDALGTVTFLDYDERGNLVGVTRDINWDRQAGFGDDITKTDFDNLNRPIKITKPDQLTSKTVYDEIGRVLSSVSGYGSTSTDDVQVASFHYPVDSRQPDVATDARGYTTTYVYDELGRVKSRSAQYRKASDPGGEAFATETRTYHPNGQIATTTNSLNQTWRFEYGQAGQRTSVTRPDNKMSSIAYTSMGEPYRWTDEMQRVRDAQYDRAGRLVKMQLPLLPPATSRAAVEYTLDAMGNAVRVKDAKGNVTAMEYDALQRLTKVTSPVVYDGVAKTNRAPVELTAYDKAGNVISTTDALGKVILYRYDTRNHLRQVELPQVPVPLGAGVTGLQSTYVTYTRDPAGRITRLRDQNGLLTEYTYNKRGWVEAVKNPASIITRTGYDDSGNVVFVKDGLNKATAMTYDGFNRRLSFSPPGAASCTYTYDSERCTARKDMAGREFGFIYDNLNRLKSELLPGNAIRDYSYDDAGNLLSVTEPGFLHKTVTCTYDAWSRLTTEVSNGVVHTHTYDLNDNVTALKHGSNAAIAHTYDAMDRLVKVVEGGRTTVWHYDLRGDVVTQQLPNSVTVKNIYDAQGRLKETIGYPSATSNSPLYSSEYVYDAMGNLRRMTEWPGSLNPRFVHVGYDKAYRMTAEVVLKGSWSSWEASLYSYDSGDRRTSLTRAASVGVAQTVNYTYDEGGLNQMLSATVVGTGTSVAFAYDNNGNRRSRTSGGLAENYAFDVEDRLVGISGPFGTQTFSYDYRGRRISRTSGSTTTHVSYAGQLSALEWTTSAATPTRQLVRGVGMDGGVAGVAYTLDGTTPSYLHYNHRGDVTAKSDSNRSLTLIKAYDGFGKGTVLSGSEGTLRHSASTKEADTPSLLNEGFRERDIETGSFLSRDPLEFVDGPNMYGYVQHNPWTTFDPWGLEDHQWHHMFPQELESMFESIGISVHDSKYGRMLPRSAHEAIHSGRGFGPGGMWNDSWRQFAENTARTPPEERRLLAFRHLRSMRRDPRFSTHLARGFPVIKGKNYDIDYSGKTGAEKSKIIENSIDAWKKAKDKVDRIGARGLGKVAKRGGRYVLRSIPGVVLVLQAGAYYQKGWAGVPDAVLDNIPYVGLAKASYEFGSGESLFPSEVEKEANEMAAMEAALDNEILEAELALQGRFNDQLRGVDEWLKGGLAGPPPPVTVPLLVVPSTPPPIPSESPRVHVDADYPSVTGRLDGS